MDPLSITASVITVAALAAQTCRAFSKLRSICKVLPGRLHAFNNEVADIEVVLYQVASIVNERGCLPVPESEQVNIPQLLRQAKTKLNELKGIVDELTVACDQAKISILRAHAWRKEQRRLQTLQEDIKTIKCSLNIMLGASNSRDMMRIRLDLETLSAVTSQSAQEQNILRDEVLGGLAEVYRQVDQRIGRVEEMLKIQSDQIQASQLNQLGPFYRAPPPHRRRFPRATSTDSEPPKPARSEGVGIRVTQYAIACQPGCPCACHSRRGSVTPALVDRILGQLFVGYAGLPVISPKCDTDACEKPQIPHVSVEYWFPLGFFWSQILRLQMGYQPNVGPQLQLSTLRRVPDSAPCVNFALNGNIEGLKDLFKRGLASPRDVSSTRGYSILRWALYGKQYKTCKFLVYAGADPDYRPIAATDNSPRNKACDVILQGGLAREVVETLGCLTEGSDFIEEQNFTQMHKIVLGLSMLSLEKEILMHPDSIDLIDAMGRTPLLWAAARGDERSVVTLLSYGADPNKMDVQLAGPVSYAADRGHTMCVRLLLEAGADPDPRTPGHKLGSALNCAARNALDPLLLKTLLDFGADIEASGVDGMTSLIHATRTDNTSFVILLLEYGADINATSKVGQTALTTAITYNSHNVLQLLLDRWSEYSECPRLKGPHLLQIAALYADIETMTILTASDHFMLKYDKDYTLGDFASRLRERSDVTDKLILAFEDLLSVINQQPESKRSVESLTEAGLLSHRNSGLEKLDSKIYSDQDDSDDAFENALESLEPASSDDETSCPVYSPV